jgi:hypothetical protein
MAAKEAQIKERPILFSGEMVRAILEGRKTQTRRVVKGLPPSTRCASAIPESDYQWRFTDFDSRTVDLRCPYGRPAIPLEPCVRLWVRESFYAFGKYQYTGKLTETGKPEIDFMDLTIQSGFAYQYATDTAPKLSSRFELGWHKRPSIFIPRQASRITLRIENIRVERLQDISYDDAAAEGVDSWLHKCPGCSEHWGCSQPSQNPPRCDVFMLGYKESFKSGWNTINAKRGYSFESNPWVWVIEFKRLDS